MDVVAILVTVILTVAAAVAVVCTTSKLQAQDRKRAPFRALLDELKLNLSRAHIINARDNRCFVIYPGLRTEAYDNARLAGVLLSLQEDVRGGCTICTK